MTEKILSFAQIHYPKQLENLSGGKQEGNFKTHIPALIPVAEKLMVFLGGSTLIKGESKSGNRFNLTLIWYQNRPNHCQKLTTSRILNCLAGRSELFVYQCRAIQTVEIATKIGRPEKHFWYFIQPLTWNIDEDTGEVLDSAANLYIENAWEHGYSTFLYRESKLSVGCIVLLGAEHEHFDALQIAKNLASGLSNKLCFLF